MSDLTTANLLSDESLVGRIADEFTECLQRGERPDIEDYARRHPRVASLLRQVLPALQAMATAATAPPRVVAPAVREPVPGCLGDFRLVREVGRGGMGVVYEAMQLSLNRRVALKVLPFAAALDARQLQRFKNEAQAAAGLHHPHIVPVFGVGTDRGVHYYAMQFIEGESLAALIRELRQAAGLAPDDSVPVALGAPAGGHLSGNLTPAERGPAGSSGNPEGPPAGAPSPDTAQQVATTLIAPGAGTDAAYFRAVARLGLQAAGALEYAHQQGIVHRDIKPANVMVDLGGHLWITDFGLARLQRGDDGLTLTGDVVGTLRYMAPEQALGRRLEVDHRTDVYSLGVTLYELLAFRPAFGGRDREELLRQVAADEPRPPRRLNPAVPRELETIVLKAMAKAPEDRYPTAQALAEDLQRYLDDRPIRARRPSWIQRLAKFTRRHRMLLRVISTTGLVALVVNTLSIYEALQSKQAALQAEAEQRRLAEDNFRNAIQMLQEVYFGQYGLLRDPERLRTDQNRHLLEKALDCYELFVERNRDNPKVQPEIARAEARAAELHYRLARVPQAEDKYHRAINRFQALRAAHPDDPGYRLELAHCLDSLAVIQVDHRRFAEAEQLHWQALPLLLEVARTRPDDRDCQEKLAFCYFNLAQAQVELGRWDEAKEAYDKTLAVVRRLVHDDPNSVEYRFDLALTHKSLAALLARGSRLGDARAEFEKAVDGFKALAGAPNGVGSRSQLANTLDCQATFLRKTGALAEAEAAESQSVELMTRLVQEYPNVVVYQSDLAAGHGHLAEILTARHQFAEARRYSGLAANALEGLVERHPQLPKLKEMLADAQAKAGNLFIECDRPADAWRAYARSRELLLSLTEHFPDVPNYRQMAAGACICVGNLLRLSKHLTEADTELRQAVALADELVQQHPHDADYRNLLAKAQSALGTELEAAGQLADAEQALRAGIAAERKLAEEASAVPEYREWLGHAEGELARLLRLGGRRAEADEADRRALEWFEQLVGLCPTSESYRERVCYLSACRADYLEKTRKYPDAEKAYRRALALAQELACEFKDNKVYRFNHVALHYKLGKLLLTLDRPAEAKATFEQALALDRKFVPALNALAGLLATCPDATQRDPARAVCLARLAVDLAPNSRDCWVTLGEARLMTGDWAGAVESVRQVVRLYHAEAQRRARQASAPCPGSPPPKDPVVRRGGTGTAPAPQGRAGAPPPKKLLSP